MQARTLKNVIKKIESWGKIVLPTKNYGKRSTLNVSYTTHIYSYIMRILLTFSSLYLSFMHTTPQSI